MRADHLTATAQGMLDPNTLGGEAQVALTVDALAPFAERYGQPVDGTAELQANLAVGAGAEVISIDLYGGAHELSGLPDGIGRAARAGRSPWRPTPSWSRTTASRSPTCGSRGPLPRSTASSSWACPGRRWTAALSIDLDNLAPLSPLLGLELDGPLTAQAQLGGALHKPAIELAARSPGLLIAGEQLDALDARRLGRGHARGRGRQAPPGRDARGTSRPSSRRRSSCVAPQLRLSDVSLSAPRTRAGGNLSIDLERRLVEGELTGRSRAAARARRVAAGATRGRARVRGARLGQGRRAGGRPDGARPRPRGRFRPARPARAAAAASPTPCGRRASPPT